MGPRLLPLLRFAFLLVATTSSVWAGAPGQQRKLPAPARLVLDPSDAPVVPAPAPPPAVTTSFQVRASRLGLTARRQIDVTVEMRGLEGTMDVNFDRPIRGFFGIGRVRLTVHVLDAAGAEVDQLRSSVPSGCRRLSLPLSFDQPGSYTLVLGEKDLAAGRARMRVLPGGEARVTVNALGPLARP